METIVKVVSTLSDLYKEINPATLSGAIDIIVVEHPDGSLHCSPFHVRFGKMHLLRPQEKKVEIKVNDLPVDFPMKVGEAGEAFFVMETKKDIPFELETSPLGPQPVISTLPPSLTLDINAANSVIPPALLSSTTWHEQQIRSQLSPIEVSRDHTQSAPPFMVADYINGKDSLSDTEIDTVDLRKRLKPLKVLNNDPLSDSEMDYSHEKLKKDWYWKWGGLPKIETMPVKPDETTLNKSPKKKDEAKEAVKNKEVKEMTSPERIKNNDESSPEIKKKKSAQEINKQVQEKFKVNTIPPKKVLNLKPILSLCGTGLVPPGKTFKEFFDESKIDFTKFNPSILQDPHLVIELDGNYYTWSALQPLLLYEWFFQKDAPEDYFKVFGSNLDESVKRSTWSQWFSRPAKTSTSSATTTTGTATTTSVPVSATESVVEEKKPEKTTVTSTVSSPAVIRYTKTLRLTSEQLKSLNLKYGSNSVSFSVTSSYSGVATCSARIFLWKHDVNVVVSDIDGTITKSDALGHLFTFVGKDWTHPGIANLYTNIFKNGYVIMYLTSRAIGQADWTRGYLRGIEQGSFNLPDGPVIMSPDRLIAALKREVIDRKPEEFKIAALSDIKSLFPRNPFYAGFGNRITDALSYRAVDIPPSRIYSINSLGEVKMDFFFGYSSSYIKLTDLVDHIFPPVRARSASKRNSGLIKQNSISSVSTIASVESTPRERNMDIIVPIDEEEEEDEFNDYNYWKKPIPMAALPPELENKPPIPTSILSRRVRSVSFIKQQQPQTKTLVETKSVQSPLATRAVIEPKSLEIPVKNGGNKSQASSYNDNKTWILPWSQVGSAEQIAKIENLENEGEAEESEDIDDDEEEDENSELERVASSNII